MKFAMVLLCAAAALLAELAAGLKYGRRQLGLTSLGSSPMCAVTLSRLLPIAGGGEAPECAVYFFGPGRAQR